MANCSNCQRELSPLAKSCPGCGHPGPAEKEADNAAGCVALLVLGVILATFIVITPALLYNRLSGLRVPWGQFFLHSHFWWVTGGFWLAKLILTQLIVRIFLQGNAPAAEQASTYVYLGLLVLVALAAKDIRRVLESR